MTIVSGSIAASWLNARLAGCHYGVATNAARYRNAGAEWSTARTWVTGLSGGPTNVTDPDYPTNTIVDGDLLTQWTQPAASIVGSAGPIYLLFDLAIGTDKAHTIDVIMIKPIRVQSTLNVRVVAANDNAFTDFTNLPASGYLTPLHAMNTTTKLIYANLEAPGGGGQQYVGIRYLALELSLSSGTFTNVPAISEVVFGARRQFAHKPRLPHADAPVISGSSDFIARNRGMARDVNFHGATDLNIRFKPNPNNFYGITDEATQLYNFARDADDCTRPFLWVDRPFASSSTGVLDSGKWVWFPDPSFVMSAVTPGQNPAFEVDLDMPELPPFQTTEG